MLARLSIRDIVLIDRLDIDFGAGLAVLTGETGAGKSILLDAFALALGARGLVLGNDLPLGGLLLRLAALLVLLTAAAVTGIIASGFGHDVP